ncbi:MAG TPA: hypothetical protein VFH56_14245 [Acidimicrobiales bacterium]|nr:hypothetical protein [Acidimicrobiales bacterium]
MNPNTGEYVSFSEKALLPPEKAEQFSVEVQGAEEEVARLSQSIKDGRKYELLYEVTLSKLRAVKAVGKRLVKSGHPAVRAAGEDILKELE